MIQIEQNNNGKFWAVIWKDGEGMIRLNNWEEFDTARKAKNAAKKYYESNPVDFTQYEF